jgi:hypothetical protein
VTSLPIAQLGFDVPRLPEPRPDGHGGYDLRTSSDPLTASSGQPAGYSGVWLSRYEYYSSSRRESLADLRYVVVLQHGDRLTARGLPGASASQLTMDLTVDAAVITGTWVEQTEPCGQYRGARHHGAIQLLADTGRRPSGKWIGFGKDLEINSGPWNWRSWTPTSRATLSGTASTRPATTDNQMIVAPIQDDPVLAPGSPSRAKQTSAAGSRRRTTQNVVPERKSHRNDIFEPVVTSRFQNTLSDGLQRPRNSCTRVSDSRSASR